MMNLNEQTGEAAIAKRSAFQRLDRKLWGNERSIEISGSMKKCVNGQ
jgi:hypothetical protein